MTDAQMLTDALGLVLSITTGTDRSGIPEILHPLGVAGRCIEYGADAQVLAILHDILEDYPERVNREMLEQRGYPTTILDALDSITRHQDETYKEYIVRLSANKLAAIVKIADNDYNINRSDTGLVKKEAEGLRNRWVYSKLFLTKTLKGN
jgi:(p)ppGpp synthase/HD superfamily hydrolase